MENESEFHGFGEEEQAKAKRLSAECIVIDSDPEEENLAEVPNEHVKLEEPSEMEDDDQQVGLYGRQLYRCGNMGCDESAETAAALKVCIFFKHKKKRSSLNIHLFTIFHTGTLDGL